MKLDLDTFSISNTRVLFLKAFNQNLNKIRI
ncbi:hypothetical protein [Campylobacter phage CJLB-12]|nr:hypothetical protein [Campylobacter phage CJLB-12]